MGTNVSTNYITAPADKKRTLGIKLPFLVMIIKNLKKYFSFEVMVLDDKNVRRRFRASNYQSTTRVKPFICTMPMRLDEGWNQIQFNLSDFTRRAYGTNYIETLRIQTLLARRRWPAEVSGTVRRLTRLPVIVGNPTVVTRAGRPSGQPAQMARSPKALITI